MNPLLSVPLRARLPRFVAWSVVGCAAALMLSPVLAGAAQTPDAVAEGASAEGASVEGEITFVRHANGEQSGGEGVYVMNADGTGERPLFLFDDVGLPYDVFNDGMRCPAWSPDGTQLAFNAYDPASENQYIAIVDPDGSNLRRVYEISSDGQDFHQIHFPEWTPDGAGISFGFTDSVTASGVITTQGLALLNLDSGEVARLTDTLPTTYYDGSSSYRGYTYMYPFFHAWSPDGERVAIGSYSKFVYLLDAETGTLTELSETDNDAYDVDWSPDGSVIAGALRTLVTLDPDDGTRHELIGYPTAAPNVSYESVSWSPDGSQLTYITYQTDIQGDFVYWFILWVMDVETGETRELVRTPIASQHEYPQNLACVDWRPVSDVPLP